MQSDRWEQICRLGPILWVPCCYLLYFFKYAFSSITSKILNNSNLHNKDHKIYALHTFGLKYRLHLLLWQVKAVQDKTNCSYLIASHCVNPMLTLYLIAGFEVQVVAPPPSKRTSAIIGTNWQRPGLFSFQFPEEPEKLFFF